MAKDNAFQKLEKELKTAIKRRRGDYQVGAFNGISDFEPMDILSNLDKFATVLSADVMMMICEMLSDAMADACANNIRKHILEKFGASDAIIRFATEDRIPTLVRYWAGLRIDRVALQVTEPENGVARPEMKYVLSVASPNGDHIINYLQPGGILNVFELNDAGQSVFKNQTTVLADASFLSVGSIMNYAMTAVELLIFERTCCCNGINFSSKVMTQSTHTIALFKAVLMSIQNKDELLSIQSVSNEDDAKIFADKFAPCIASTMVQFAVTNGFDFDTAVKVLDEINFKLFYAREKAKKAYVEVVFTCGNTACVQSIGISDLLSVMHLNTGSKEFDIEGVANCSTAVQNRVIRFLRKTANAFMTCILLSCTTGLSAAETKGIETE